MIIIITKKKQVEKHDIDHMEIAFAALVMFSSICLVILSSGEA